MEPEIIKNGDVVTITTTNTSVETFNLADMKSELKALENQPEPTTAEKIDAVENNLTLDYYSLSRIHRIDFLRFKIAELEAL